MYFNNFTNASLMRRKSGSIAEVYYVEFVIHNVCIHNVIPEMKLAQQQKHQPEFELIWLSIVAACVTIKENVSRLPSNCHEGAKTYYTGHK